MKITQSYCVLFLLLISISINAQVNAQKFNPQKLEVTISKAIAKAYPASVRIWGFDTISNTRTSGQFTGVVVSEDGYILTAAHVNQPGNTYKIMFPDGRSCIARGLGEIDLAETPGMPDVAMMKIEGKGKWPFAEMGWSDAILKNEPCISIAYPESLDQPLPMIRFGHIQDPKNKYGFVQSTCLMEPGDSGGPLFDYLGRVIGLHSAIDIAESDNFEIPVDLYRKYWSALNKAESYSLFPAVTDTVGNDPLVRKISAIPELQNLDAQLKLSNGLKENSVLLKSSLKGKEQFIQATLVSLTGIPLKGGLHGGTVLVSKSSMVGGMPAIEMKGKAIPVSVIARDQENDLVLLKIADQFKAETNLKQRNSETILKHLKGGIILKQFHIDTLNFAQLGKILISPLNEDTCRVSVLGSMQFSLPKITSIGYLGVQVAYFGPLVFGAVQPNTSAAESKVKKGDLLLSMNGISLNNRADFTRESKKYWAGDKITIQIKRGDSVYSKEIILDFKPVVISNHPAERFIGGRSLRHDGFKQVFAHDAILKPNQNGGPVFDLDGHFYGINIARFSRVSNIVIPAKVVLDFIVASYK